MLECRPPSLRGSMLEFRDAAAPGGGESRQVGSMGVWLAPLLRKCHVRGKEVLACQAHKVPDLDPRWTIPPHDMLWMNLQGDIPPYAFFVERACAE
jgi:hypothetical protein